jgi:hypothetical protein
MIDALDQAIYDTVHQYVGPRGRVGAVALAAQVGMHPGTLNNKAYPGHDGQLTLRESIPIQLQADDFRILATYAAELGHAVIPVGQFDDCSDMELLDLYAAYHAELGETATSIRDLLAADQIDKKALNQVRREMLEDQQAGMALLSPAGGDCRCLIA